MLPPFASNSLCPLSEMPVSRGRAMMNPMSYMADVVRDLMTDEASCPLMDALVVSLDVSMFALPLLLQGGSGVTIGWDASRVLI